MSSEKYLLEVKTVQATTFKQVIDALKDILMDVNLEFDETGLKIIAMDTTHVVMVHLKLNADKFEKYYCDKKLFVGINILKLHMLIKTICNGDILTLFVDNDNSNSLGIRIENTNKNLRTTYYLSMLDINALEYNIPPVDFQSIITMPSNDLQKIIRDMSNLADTIEIRSIENNIYFKCKGDCVEQETVLGTENNQNLNIITNNHSQDIIQGVYSLKYLTMFTKCTNLNNVVEVYLKNNFPIILKYNVASLGEIKLCLAPQDS
jgi:proliferating cell nuclear antigen